MKSYSMCRILPLAVIFSLLALLCIVPCKSQDLRALTAAMHQLPSYTSKAGTVGLERERDSTNATRAFDALSQYWREGLPARLKASLFKQLSSNCAAGWQYLFNHTAPGFKSPLITIPPLPLGVYALDAFGKPPGAGYLQGNNYAYGSYDECLDTDHTQYCNGPLEIVSIAALPPAVLVQFKLGMCLPQECSKKDIETVINDTNVALYTYLQDRQIFFYMDMSQTVCQAERKPPFNAGAIVMIVISSLFALMAVLGTATDWLLKLIPAIATEYHQLSVNQDVEKTTVSENTHLLYGTTARTKRKMSKFYDFITAFSLFKTVPSILATKQPPSAITSINGIRVISMFWIILCHTHVWVFISGVKNPAKTFSVVQRWTFQAIINGFFSVDSFFFLSGLLVAYLTLRDMSRRSGRFPALMYYIHRYLRITPTYAFVLFFQWFLTVHLTDGPLYTSRHGPGSPEYQFCNQYWWTNLLYINNFHPWKLTEECMGWTWYLANDMQFYIVAPLMVVMLYYSLTLGLVNVGVFLFGSFIATGSIAGYYKFDANTFYPFFGPSHASTVTTSSDELYIKPYARISPYLVGIVLGYLLYKKVQIPFKRRINWIFYLGLWILAAFFCLSTLYGFYGTWHGHPFNLAENVVYFMFGRFTWALGLALLVFICHNGYGWVVNSFLSMGFWVPLSRLTFNAYLVHPIVLSVLFGSTRQPLLYNDVTMAVYAVAAVVLSYGAAAVVAAFVEFPLSNVEAAVFKMLGFGARESVRQSAQATESRLPPKEPVVMSRSTEMPNSPLSS